MLFDEHIKSTLNYTKGNRFDYFIGLCHAQYDKPVHTMIQMRDRQNKKLRGDLFELFCKEYLKNACWILFDEVWLWNEIPDNIRNYLGLNTRDEGIDLVAVDTKGRYYAIQSKYRKIRPEKSKQFVSWKQLSTFYSLAYRVGKFYKHIVMTNLDGVRHVTKKTNKDISICKKRFQKMTYWQWQKMSRCDSSPSLFQTPISKEDIRLKRLAYYNK